MAVVGAGAALRRHRRCSLFIPVSMRASGLSSARTSTLIACHHIAFS
jgi:hypothetical protein